MEDFYDRTRRLIGVGAMERLRKAAVLVVGLGGVGGHLAENLVRAGVGTLGLCDCDRIEESNMNRQILAVSHTLGMYKTRAAAQRFLSINGDLILREHPFRLTEKTLPELQVESYDYIADAIDDVGAKILLIREASQRGIPVISAMGAGNKTDPTRFRIASVGATHTCPLARVLRKELRSVGLSDVPVLFSDEVPPERDEAETTGVTASISYMPAVAGSLIAGRILMDLIKK
ncbi:MAG: tRNA threonylcarbamoyladenosine dehydratase [Clostridiales bacterium]|nr:tRNA threonylcarbamoyladenosine dehydratase [Clostridiales bacterium]